MNRRGSFISFALMTWGCVGLGVQTHDGWLAVAVWMIASGIILFTTTG